ncbi:MAG: glycosyltransferase [Bacteroidota bacterium]|jgi:glycosyltransferase involved in cell wall biosynthesis
MHITVLIPTYNRAFFLEKAIKSVLNQSHQKFTILISDNASTDETKSVVNKFNDTRIIYHCHDTNVGMQKNWEFCLKNINTEYFAFLEDDNYYHENHLQTALQFLENTDIGFYFCNSIFKDSYYVNKIKDLTYRKKSEIDLAELLLDINIPASGVVGRKSYIQYIDFDKAKQLWCMDRFYWRSIILNSGYIFNPAPNIVYVIHDDNITHTLLKNKKAIAKASLQNRFVDAFTVYSAIQISEIHIEQFLSKIQKIEPKDYKHILACFFTPDKIQSLEYIGNKLIDYSFPSIKFYQPVASIKRLIQIFIIKNTNWLNSLIAKENIPSLLIKRE